VVKYKTGIVMVTCCIKVDIVVVTYCGRVGKVVVKYKVSAK
jgi:hypothetical protein